MPMLWHVALELATVCQSLIGQLPKGHAAFADQLRRAATSVCLNIAEGAGRWSDRDKASRFTIARGEVGEVAAALEVGMALKILPTSASRKALELAGRIGAMLTRLIQRRR